MMFSSYFGSLLDKYPPLTSELFQTFINEESSMGGGDIDDLGDRSEVEDRMVIGCNSLLTISEMHDTFNELSVVSHRYVFSLFLHIILNKILITNSIFN